MSSTSPRTSGWTPARANSNSNCSRNGACRAGKKQGHPLQAGGKSSGFVQMPHPADQVGGHLAEDLVEHLGRAARRRGDIRQHHVHLMGSQADEQVLEGPGRNRESRVGPGQQGFDEVELQVLGQGRHGPDPQGAPLLVRTGSSEEIQQFGTGFMDGVGMVQHRAARIGQHQGSAPPVEQRFAEPGLQLGQLLAQGRGRDPQQPGRAGHPALSGDRPESQQVMVVEPLARVGPRLARVRHFGITA